MSEEIPVFPVPVTSKSWVNEMRTHREAEISVFFLLLHDDVARFRTGIKFSMKKPG